MSFLGRSIGKALTQSSKTVSLNLMKTSNFSVSPFARSLSIFSKSDSMKLTNHSNNCSCGIQGIHTRGDREIVEFLQEEIVEEKKSVANVNVPSQMGEFTLKSNDAELVLSRKFNDETVTISLNVNHTVDMNDESPDSTLESRPDFEVDVKSGSRTLSFTCQFIGDGVAGAEGEQETENAETFGISEVTVYDGEWNENTYCVSGDSLDAKLYDLFMNGLAERGITNDFATSLVDMSTNYEHSLYINLLENVQSFFKKK